MISCCSILMHVLYKPIYCVFYDYRVIKESYIHTYNTYIQTYIGLCVCVYTHTHTDRHTDTHTHTHTHTHNEYCRLIKKTKTSA